MFGGFKNLLYLCTRKQAIGRLAQLVQSVCLTSRGSGVRIPQRPQSENLGSCDQGFFLYPILWQLQLNRNNSIYIHSR